MATKKNDIALSFDKAEYYTLQEASDYLNRKHGIDNITSRKLLKHIVSYNTPCFIHMQGFDVEVWISENKLKYHDNSALCDLANQDLRDSINEIINEENFLFGLLLEINPSTIRKFLFSIDEKIFIDSFLDELERPFIGVLFIDNLNNDSRNMKFLIKDLNRPIKQDSNIIINQLAVKFCEWQGEAVTKEYLDKKLKELKPTPVGYESFSYEEGGGGYTPNFRVGLDELIILQRGLEELEVQIIENAPIPEKQHMKPSNIQMLPRVKGRSQNKTLVQAIANHIAKNEWAKDTEYKIRISEMCEIVWSKLIDLEFHLIPNAMPDKAISIREWLENIPPHASIQGRPSTK